ncbi:MAG TPA: peptidoglycan DD-metalloendopeptidase family protein [Thioalkalivibrio sp.]|jgi:murein DD-endopeptidase|nr:peptidoglycan DD-metalloendopeptidase family protein [Thioalkalivibrio sp.]
MAAYKTLFSLAIFGAASASAITASSFFQSEQQFSGEAVYFDETAFFVGRSCLPRPAAPSGDEPAAGVRPMAEGFLAKQVARMLRGPNPVEATPSDTVITSYGVHDLGGSTADPNNLHWAQHTVQTGEHLASLWRSQWGMSLGTLWGLLAEPKNAALLNQVHPGQQVEWLHNANGDLERLRLWTDRSTGHEWRRSSNGDGFVLKEIKGERTFTHRVVTGRVQSDLATTLGQSGTLSGPDAQALARLLDRHLPVKEKAGAGDQFTLLIEQETLVGDDIPHAVRLLAFEYRGQTLQTTGVRHSNDRFYTPEGRSLLPPFDRKPFAGEFRISSSYNLGRRHPVTGRVAPHQGTDFQMPPGTPVLAPADGMVTLVGNHPRAGRHIEIDHGQGYTTRYLHLQESSVRTGQAVQRGDRIALSGKSGRTTGPHLHYELHVEGRPVDPMRADLPSTESLTGNDLQEFQLAARPFTAELRNATASRQLAMRPFSSLGL